MTYAVRFLAALMLLALSACSSPESRVAGHLAKARELMEQENFDKAKLEAKNAVQIDQKNAEGHMILAKIAWREGDIREAFPHLQIAVESDPKLVEARLRLADLFMSAGDVKAATEQLDALKKLDPDRADVHLLAGKLLFRQGDTKGAAAEIDAALAADPAFLDAITSKASLLSTQGDNPGALAFIEQSIGKMQGGDKDTLREFRLTFLRAIGRLEDYEAGLVQLVKEYPDRSQYRYQLLDLYQAQRRLDDQERTLRELVDTDPDNHLVKVRLASFLANGKQPEAAEKLLKDAIAKYPDSVDLRIALGDFYRFSKRSADAMAVYRQAADKWPETTTDGQQARNRIVAQHVMDGNVKQAQADIDAILKAAPDNTDALLTRATFSFLDREYDEAIADLRTVLRRQRSVDASLLLARAYVGIGDTVVAKDTYRRILEENPGNAAAAKELAALLSNQGEQAAASEILRRFLAIKPDDPEASTALVRNLLAERETEAAEAEARRMIEQGAAVAGQTQLGQVLASRGSSADAVASYKAVLDKDPNQPEALTNLVNLLLANNRAGEAIGYLERYPKGDVTASVLLGKVYAAQGDVAGAREVINQAISQHPNDARPYLALGALAEQDSPEQISILERGWKAAPGDLNIGLILGSINERLGNFEEAIRIYEQVLAKSPNSVVIINNLASLLLDHRSDRESLIRALELARPLSGTNMAMTLDTLGWAYYRNGDYPNAVRQLERAVALESDNALLLYHLGKAYAGAGNRESARQYLTEAVEGAAGASFLTDARSTLAKLEGG